ncbi:MAG: UbiD family decarboxylase [Candidatus Thermoplasmatota archaeon]|nr:UbiD family decarboxylase [Candidatus Thermoplasmatota archaeon]MEE3083378.1 UbiD family decarboxylase [Candidatus Thermoplasmatota archaeon]
MGWRRLGRYLRSLEDKADLIRITHPVDCYLEAGCIADKLVKNGGPAVIFEQPRLSDGSISKFPLAMNIFGTRRRTNQALRVEKPSEIGERLTALMKPDIGTFVKRPWKAWPLAMNALSLPPKKVRKGACQQVRMSEPDVTKLPIPTTWPMDGGPFITLPLVVTKDPKTNEHNLGMYRAQVYGPTEVGLHWQMHKHGADHAAATDGKMPVAICLGGPPEVMFSAIAPLPDNLEEYMFAGLLGEKRLRITKCLTQDLWVPAEADVVIEGYTIPGETRMEGPFGDHFGHYSLEGEFPVLHVTAITHRKDAVIPMTIVGKPPMEDGYLGEAIGDAFLPVLRFQHRDVCDVFLPLETGFHNLAIVSSKQRYPAQARKTALGLWGAGQMMFLKTIVATGPEHDVKDLEKLLDVLDQNVSIPDDLIVLDGMVADQLAHAAPFEGVHSKLLIDASTSRKQDTAAISLDGINNITQYRWIRPSMLVVTTTIDGGPSPSENTEKNDEEAAAKQRDEISQLMNSIWQLDVSNNLRWLFITDDSVDLEVDSAMRTLLWQLFCRFEVSRDLYFSPDGSRICWDATAPIPSMGGRMPVRRWPAVCLHDPDIQQKVDSWYEEAVRSWV